MVSILVLLDSRIKHTYGRLARRQRPQVSILVLLDSRIKLLRCGKNMFIWIVSILVLLDSRIKRFRRYSWSSVILRFQSLFYWTAESNGAKTDTKKLIDTVSILVLLDSRIKHSDKLFGRNNADVSILVLLDSRIKLLILCLHCFLVYRFNPCFIGQQNQTYEDDLPTVVEIMFQSLFYWTAESNCEVSRSAKATPRVSILVLLDSRIKPVSVLLVLSIWNCFNPCFIGQQNQTQKNTANIVIFNCFNPCFIGQQNQTKPHTDGNPIKDSFNPCFIGQQNQTHKPHKNLRAKI